MKIFNKITDLVGNTPLMELENFEKENNLSAKVLAKLEFFNPAGSVKDRVAAKMIADAKEKGILKPGSVLRLIMLTMVTAPRMVVLPKIYVEYSFKAYEPM